MTASSICKRLIAALWLVLSVVSAASAQPTQSFARIYFGNGTSVAPSMAFQSEPTLGFYRVSSGVIGIAGGTLQSTSVSLFGNDSPSLTSPTKYFQFKNNRSAALGSSEFWGGSFYHTFTSSNSWSGTGVGVGFDTLVAGTQNASGDIYSVYSNAAATTTGAVTKMESYRAAVNRSGGNLTTARGFAATGIFSGSSITGLDWAAFEAYTPSLSGGATMNIGYGALMNAPPQSGGTLNYWRGIAILNQTTPLTENSVPLEISTPNSGYMRIWAKGKIDSQVVDGTGTLTTETNDTIGHSFKYTYTGDDRGTAIHGSYANATVTPSETLTVDISGLQADGVLTDGEARSVGGLFGWGELDGDAVVTVGLYGTYGEFGHYSSATTPYGAAFEGDYGVNAGTVTDAYVYKANDSWDTGGVVTNAIAFGPTTPITTGASSNWQFRAPTESSTYGGIAGQGAFVDGPGALTVADNGTGSNATATLTPTTSLIKVTCSDTNGCDITMGETGVLDGQQVRIVNVSSNTANFADTSGVSELAGAAALGQWDSLSLLYVTDRWVEIGRSNN